MQIGSIRLQQHSYSKKPLMFDISEHTALQAGRNHQQVNQKAATIVATATLALLKASASILQKLIQGIINRLGGGKKDSSIEIKVNEQLVFKGKVGEKPTVNKLSVNDLTAILEPAIADSKQNLELVVKADNKIVYASNRGKVKLDQLDAFLQAAKNPKQKVASNLVQGENEVNQPFTPNAPKITVPTNEQQGASNDTKSVLDRELNSNSLLAVFSAKRVLDKLQTNEYENKSYSFRKEGNNIIVSAKDGRGEIARSEQREITGSLSEQDVIHLIQLNQAVFKTMNNNTQEQTREKLATSVGRQPVKTGSQEIER